MTGRRPAGRAGAAAVVLAVAASLVACASGPTAAPTSPAPTRSPTSTVEYSPGLTEDVYLPDGPGQDGGQDGGRVPLVVMVPGGSWTTADPAGFAGLAAALADHGVAAAPTHIRAAQDGVTYPVPIDDVLCAVAAATAEVRRQGRAPGPVAVLGHSSGAHLAALAVLAVDDFTPECDTPLVRPDALIGLSGPYDIARVPDLASALLGSEPDEDPGAWSSANPVQRADLRPGVPVLLLHGDSDTMVPPSSTTEFAEALERAGHPTTVEMVPGADHQSIYRADVAGDPVATWLHRLPTR